MKRIGVLFGPENSFPGALVEHINARHLEGIRAEFVEVGAVRFDQTTPYAVIVDRVSHDVPFYRAFLKHAALQGTVILNDPFWWSADDKFFNYALARKLGVAVPPTVMLPHKQHPGSTSDRTMRNLEYPLDWESVFALVGEHGFLKPIDGGGWRNVTEVHTRDEFFCAYDATGELCMVYQKAVEYQQYFRCFVVGQKKVRVMPYDPRSPHAERYAPGLPNAEKKLLKKMEQDAQTLCRALGYDFNTVEFAVEDGIPYAIDFMNPVPDTELHSVGQENFDWVVKEMADLAITRAKAAPVKRALKWTAFLGSGEGPVKKRPKKKVPKKISSAKAVGDLPLAEMRVRGQATEADASPKV